MDGLSEKETTEGLRGLGVDEKHTLNFNHDRGSMTFYPKIMQLCDKKNSEYTYEIIPFKK